MQIVLQADQKGGFVLPPCNTVKDFVTLDVQFSVLGNLAVID